MSETGSKKGMQATLLDVSKRWGGNKKIALFTTHLDPFNVSTRRRQVQQIKPFMKSFLNDLESEMSEIAVILTGDFNIDYSSVNYQDMMEIFGSGVIDLQEQHGQASSKTFGGNEYHRKERTIDYAFLFERLSPNQTPPFLPLKLKYFHVIHQKPPQQVLSDHYPLSFTLSMY